MIQSSKEAKKTVKRKENLMKGGSKAMALLILYKVSEIMSDGTPLSHNEIADILAKWFDEDEEAI